MPRNSTPPPRDPVSHHEEHQDPFDTLLDLENSYYTEGYNLGVADGARAGRIEGRVFGLEKGFEKFTALGRLGGRVAVWEARLPADGGTSALPLTGSSERLDKHVRRLKNLTDLETLSCENDEESVEEFEEKLKEARAKARLVETIVGEERSGINVAGEAEDKGRPSTLATRTVRVKKNEGGKATGEMEDFAGLPGASSLRRNAE